MDTHYSQRNNNLLESNLNRWDRHHPNCSKEEAILSQMGEHW